MTTMRHRMQEALNRLPAIGKRELLPKLRAQLEAISGAEPHKDHVAYTVPALPMRTVEEVLAERRSKGDES